MQTTLADIAKLVDGLLIGTGDLVIHGAATLCDAEPGQITLVDCQEKGRNLSACRASAVIAPKQFDADGLPTIHVDDVHGAFTAVLSYFRPPRREQRLGISPQAVVSPTARLGRDVDVHPLATIGDDAIVGDGATIHAGAQVMNGCQIGEGTIIFPNAVLYENTIVGPRCVIHAGAVLGAWGFGYCMVEGRHQISAQLGNVVLGADVEIGAGTTIDRGTYGPTVIGEGTKIDDLVMVAHNCRIGKHNMLCSQVGIAGSTTTGDYVVMAGQVGVRDHVHIGDQAVLGAMAGVVNDVPDGARMIGIPATPEREQKLKQAALSKLPEMRRELRKLQKRFEDLVAHCQGDNEETPAEEERPAKNASRRAVA